MTDYGILGISFVVLFFLGFASSTIGTIGIVLVGASAYIQHIRYTSFMNLLINFYLDFISADEEQ